MKNWIVVYFTRDGEVYGPVWEVESKIKPTRWAKARFPSGAHSHKIGQVEEFSEQGYRDSFIKALS